METGATVAQRGQNPGKRALPPQFSDSMLQLLDDLTNYNLARSRVPQRQSSRHPVVETCHGRCIAALVKEGTEVPGHDAAVR